MKILPHYYVKFVFGLKGDAPKMVQGTLTRTVFGALIPRVQTWQHTMGRAYAVTWLNMKLEVR